MLDQARATIPDPRFDKRMSNPFIDDASFDFVPA
jgi:hypothetical protein